MSIESIYAEAVAAAETRGVEGIDVAVPRRMDGGTEVEEEMAIDVAMRVLPIAHGRTAGKVLLVEATDTQWIVTVEDRGPATTAQALAAAVGRR